MKENISIRLKQIMKDRNLRQVDILKLTEKYSEEFGFKITKTDLTQYVSGKTNPGQAKLFLLAKALDVRESWLRGYDVTPERTQGKKNEENLHSNEMNDDKLVVDISKIGINKRIAKRLRFLRESNNITLADLIGDLNIDKRAYELAEQGRLSLMQYDLIKIADYYDVNVDWILGRSNVMTSKEDVTEVVDQYFTNLKQKDLIKDPENIDDRQAKTILNTLFGEEKGKVLFQEFLEKKDKDE